MNKIIEVFIAAINFLCDMRKYVEYGMRNV